MKFTTAALLGGAITLMNFDGANAEKYEMEGPEAALILNRINTKRARHENTWPLKYVNRLSENVNLLCVI